MKKKIIDISLLVSFFLFIILTVLVLVVDVKVNDVTGTDIGLSTFNEFFNDLPKNNIWDQISDIVMYISLASILVFVGIGIYQWIKRRSLKKVDFEIMFLGVFIVLMVGFWLVFDKLVVINYRPMKINGEIESSYPSTHVMVVTFLLFASCYFINKKWNTKLVNVLSYTVASIIVIATSIFRVAAGMHWVTDVLGGILLGIVLYLGFLSVILLHQQRLDKKKENMELE